MAFIIWHCLQICIFSKVAFLGLLVDHSASFTSTFTVPSLVSTPTVLALQGCSKRLAEWMNNSSLQFWVESDSNCCSVSVFSCLLLSQITPSKTPSLSVEGKRKAEAGCLDCNFDQHQLARYLPVIKQWRRVQQSGFLHSGYARIKVTACDSVDPTLPKTQTSFLTVAPWHFILSLNGGKKIVICREALLSDM